MLSRTTVWRRARQQMAFEIWGWRNIKCACYSVRLWKVVKSKLFSRFTNISVNSVYFPANLIRNRLSMICSGEITTFIFPPAVDQSYLGYILFGFTHGWWWGFKDDIGTNESSWKNGNNIGHGAIESNECKRCSSFIMLVRFLTNMYETMMILDKQPHHLLDTLRCFLLGRSLKNNLVRHQFVSTYLVDHLRKELLTFAKHSVREVVQGERCILSIRNTSFQQYFGEYKEMIADSAKKGAKRGGLKSKEHEMDDKW
jgi:hypothetical protein